jgi:uncharacterized protein YjdB
MYRTKKILLSIFLSITMILISLPLQTISVNASSTISFIILSQYKANVDIGDEFYILAFTSNGKLASWKSSNSKVASVNTYGKVTPKKAGTATITAKVSKAEASCKVTVNKTQISINHTSASIEHGETIKLSANTSNKSSISWKSSKKSVATIDEYGVVTGIKPGETTITASADGSRKTCKIKVKSPTVKLSKTKITLYRNQTKTLSATVSSGINPKWKTNKKSVAMVDDSGTITAIKHGTAIITATVDGVSKTCEVIVKQPTITLSSSETTIKKGNSESIVAKVSSGNTPIWSSSNTNIAIVDSSGSITALAKGRAYIYAKEDGISARCVVYVTE